MSPDTLTIVGVGLIGGSLGLAAKANGAARRVVGVGRDAASLEKARALGAIDEPCLDLAAAARRSDLVVFCTPVDRIAAQVLEAAPHCRPGTVLTDAGSTKAGVVTAVDGRLPEGVAFVGSHPVAGSEKRGPEHARADLFRNRVCVVTPTRHSAPAAVERVAAFWQSVGMRVRRMDPFAHDDALALTSHLPHLAASAVAGVVPVELLDLAATGFRDTTRVAAGDPGLWSAIFLHNRGAVLAAAERLTAWLGEFRSLMESGDAAGLTDLLARAKKVRDALGS
jgi:cyclohexadieny/prephenate dehydrogenase